MLDKQSIPKLFEAQQLFFNSGKTLSLKFRIAQLHKLKKMIQDHEADFTEALRQDLEKSPTEAYGTEIGFVLGELNYHIKHLKKWMKPEKVGSPLVLLPAKSYLHHEPKGNVLILSPWNYPIMLVLAPLIGAISAGNTAIIKPSELAPHSSQLFARIISKTFDAAFVKIVEGGVSEAQELLDLKFNHIFFTGSPKVGRLVMQKAAEQMIPVTLELGGKSPAVVNSDANIKQAAKRIVWGKFINAGQTCIAPDYLLVHKDVAQELMQEMREVILSFYGSEPMDNPDFPRIITTEAVKRLAAYLEGASIFHGGRYSIEKCAFEPTIVQDVSLSSPLMTEEIFGPILPVVLFEKYTDIIPMVNRRPSPLALYIFTKCKKVQDELIQKIRAGGITINDTLMHVANSNLPFGGIGNSGMGKYHGKYSFQIFSNLKPLVYRSTTIDIPLRYPPYLNKLNWIKRIMK